MITYFHISEITKRLKEILSHIQHTERPGCCSET